MVSIHNAFHLQCIRVSMVTTSLFSEQNFLKGGNIEQNLPAYPGHHRTHAVCHNIRHKRHRNTYYVLKKKNKQTMLINYAPCWKITCLATNSTAKTIWLRDLTSFMIKTTLKMHIFTLILNMSGIVQASQEKSSARSLTSKASVARNMHLRYRIKQRTL